MKVLHIVGGGLRGGAARGAYWLHQGLIELGVDSKILSNAEDTLNDPKIESISKTKKQKINNMLRVQLDLLPTHLYSKRRRVIFNASFFGYDFTTHRLYNWADIIHLHWINDGFINIKHLSKVKKPIIWTMRDMWPMTGGCHYSMDCENFRSGCGNCKQLNSQRKYDLSWWVIKRKIKYFPKNMKIVGISYWLSDKARESIVFKDFDIRTIHNNLNCKEFFPVERTVARDVLEINTNKKIILAGAQNLKDFYKGFVKFIEAVKYLDKNKYLLVFFGNIDDDSINNLGFEYKNFGFLYDIVSLRLLNSASDVFVSSSIMDAFGKTLAESMACGTPVVCFDATGPRDIISHKIDGYKAKPFDAIDLARGIEWITEDEKRWNILSKQARQKVEKEFRLELIAQKYLDLYNEILEKQRVLSE
jgi:glycosyltransferase involved in cell wall biosynthesis